jgi:hypothetical protein
MGIPPPRDCLELKTAACDHTIRRCCQSNFHADYRRWLDLFSDEQVNAMKNDPLDDSFGWSCVEAEIEIGKMS